jgi:hypothetical protein
VEVLRGRNTDAVSLLEEAAGICSGAGMSLRAACARLRMGELLGDRAGQACMEDALARIAAVGIEEPHRWASMYALGFGSEVPRA